MGSGNAIRLAVGLLALAGVPLAHALYQPLTPPVGWTAGTGAGAMYQAATSESWHNYMVRTKAAASVGGRSVQVPVGLRLAGNAGPYLAGRIASAAAMGPTGIVAGGLTLAAAMAIPAVADWLYGLDEPVRYNPEHGFTVELYESGIGWTNVGRPGFSSTPRAAVQPNWPNTELSCTIEPSGLRAACYSVASGNFVTYANGSVQNMPTGEWGSVEFSQRVLPQIQNLVPPLPLVEALPIPWPVQQPIFNPTETLTPQPQPLTVPEGLPQPIPNTSPQQYRHPQSVIRPAGTAAEPWRVDVTSTETVSNDPNPAPDPEVDPNAPSAEPEKTPDLCEKNPDILACAKPELDTPDEDIPREDREIEYEAEDLFGTGSCPADMVANIATLGGRQVTVWDWQKACDYALPLRAIVLSLATFAAFLIVMPGETRV